MGLEYAKEHRLKVDVVCPIVFDFTTKHPEYKPLLGIRGYKPAHPAAHVALADLRS
jgi:hypothetical protein